MSDSFYYFFSAVPQVLGGILALFGVFVIFKIQGLKTQLIGISRPLITIVELLHEEDLRLHNDSRMTSVVTNTSTILRESVLREDTHEIKAILDKITIIVSDFKQQFETYQRHYNDVYNALQTLIKNTIRLSVLTAILIVFCLATIPFGDLILQHPIVLYLIFSVVVLCICISFGGLISILKKALNDSGIASIKNRG